MIDTEIEFEQKVEEVLYKILKREGICLNSSGQTKLTPNEVFIGEEMEEYMEDKQCLIWLGSTEKGKAQDVKCNQVYISQRGSMLVDKPIPLSFEEVFNIWEAYFKGNSLEDIYFTVIFEEDNVGLSDVRLVIWALIHGKFNYVLNFIKEDRYNFDFKKYSGRY